MKKLEPHQELLRDGIVKSAEMPKSNLTDKQEKMAGTFYRLNFRLARRKLIKSKKE